MTSRAAGLPSAAQHASRFIFEIGGGVTEFVPQKPIGSMRASTAGHEPFAGLGGSTTAARQTFEILQFTGAYLFVDTPSGNYCRLRKNAPPYREPEPRPSY